MRWEHPCTLCRMSCGGPEAVTSTSIGVLKKHASASGVLTVFPMPADRAHPEVQGAVCGGSNPVHCTAADVVAKRHWAALQGGVPELHTSAQCVLCSQHLASNLLSPVADCMLRSEMHLVCRNCKSSWLSL